MKLSLPDVTLCAVTAINHELTLRSINKCLELCDFGDVVMISSQPMQADFHVDVVPHFTGAEYAPFVCSKLAHYTSTPFNLLVQYDSYATDPSAWDPGFLNYDYIGPTWPWQPHGLRVGNSGFCLRSKKLLDVLAKWPLPPTGHFLDDTFICHTIRKELDSKHGIIIAPEPIANQFAYERHEPDQPTFGFHGIFNFWRHNTDAEMLEVFRLMDDYYIPSRAFAEVVFRYHDLGRPEVFVSAYKRVRDRVGLSNLKTHLLQYLKDELFIDRLIQNGEGMTAV